MNEMPLSSSTSWLGDILARITLYELLCLSKATQDAPREVLANSEVFLSHVAEATKKACLYCNLVSGHTSYVTFTLEDMQLKNIKYNKPLHNMGYISSIEVGRIQVDLRLALSIIS